MGKIVFSLFASKAIGLGMTFAGIIFLLGILPFIFSFIPGLGFENGTISFNILSPMTAILAQAPPMLRHMIGYTRMDFGLPLVAAAAVYNLIWQVVKSAK